MKRKFVLLTLLMCILGGFNLSNLNAQTTVMIDGADNATYSIADNWQGYGASQQIYTATEIGSAGTITKIAFHKADNTNDGNRTWSIYLKEIDATSFTNNSTYPMTSNDLVYSGTFNASSGWVTLDINDFAYNGGNLLVTVLDNSGSKSPGDQNWSYNTSIYSKCLVKSQDASIDITSSNQFNVFGGRFSIQLTFEGGAAQPQPQIIEIGSPATESYYFPTNRAYNYTLTQQVYTNAEIGKTNIDVKSIAFKDNSGVESTRNLEIYMKNTTDDGCSATSKQMNANELCFSGNVTFAANDWTTITFTTSFEYSDGNFLLCVVDKTGNYGDWSNFATYKTSSTNKSFYIYSDNTPYSASSEYTNASTDVKNCIKIGYTESVAVEPAVPTNLTAYAYTYNTVDLSWTDAENAKKYNVYQGNDKIAENVSGTYFQVTGLEAETYYCFTVTAVNGSKESGHSGSACATTPKEPEMCNVVFTLTDTYGDGWNSGYVHIYDGNNIDEVMVFPNPYNKEIKTKTYTLSIPQGTVITGELNAGLYPDEIGLTIAYEGGENIYTIGSDNDFNQNELKTILSSYKVDCTVPVPDAPVVKAVATSRSSINLTWEDVDLAISYNVYDNNGDILAEGLTETSYSVTGLDASTNYCFTVIAVGESGESDPAQACATTLDNMSEGVIGDGTGNNFSIPIDAFHNYSFSQQFYTKDEILAAGGCEGLITSLAYHVNNITTSYTSRNLKIYMTNVDELNEVIFGSGDVSCSLNTNDLVFEGNINFTEDWVKIPFTTPFSYNGNHISITVIDNTGVRDGYDIYFTVHSKFTNNTNWTANKGSNDTPIDPTALMGIGNGIRNDIKLSFVSEDVDIKFIGTGAWNDFENWNVKYVPTADKDVIISGNAVITNDVTINSITIDGGSLTVEANNSLTINGNMTNDDASAFVIEDSAQVFQTNDNVLATFLMNVENPTGELVKDNITGWQFISSPMKDAATAGFETEGGYDLFKYVGDIDTEDDLEWINYKSHKDTDFETKFKQGRGYMASYHAENGIAEFVGELNNATNFSFDELTYHGDDHFANFFLLGNPFAFDMKWNNNNIAASGLAEGYAVVTTDGSYNYATTGDIKIGDGFFVKVTGTNPSLSYTANTRNRNVDENKYINLIASNKAGNDNVIINFADNGRDGFAKLKNFNEDIAEIYVKDNEKRYGILNYDEDIEEIDVYFNAKKIGYYTINAISNADFSNVTLIDRITGIETNILTDSYTFQATTNDSPERFIIRIDKETESENFVYKSGEELIINAKGCVQIIDVMGRIVYSNDIVNDNHRINISSFKNATYIVRVVNTNEVKTQKIVIW